MKLVDLGMVQGAVDEARRELGGDYLVKYFKECEVAKIEPSRAKTLRIITHHLGSYD